MSLIEIYSSLLVHIAEQHDTWSVTSEEAPCTITRVESEGTLPLSIAVHGNEEKAHLLFHVYDDEILKNLAHRYLELKNESDIRNKESDSDFILMIDSDGFAAVYSAVETPHEDFTSQFEVLIQKAEKTLINAIKLADKELEEIGNSSSSSANSIIGPVTGKLTVVEVLDKYFEHHGYANKHDKENKRYIFGFETSVYMNEESYPNFRIIISYSDDSLLRFSTPWLYKIDFSKASYHFIASIIAWYQFEYKFLAMSLDPSDGELRISIDIPIEKGEIHITQIHRIVTFIQSFVEETYKELFSLVLTDSEAAEEKLNKLITNYNKKRESAAWISKTKEKMIGLSEEQRKAIEAILEENQDKAATEMGGI